MEEVEYLGERVYRWQVGASTFLAWPEKGARLMNWNLSFPDGSFRDIVRWPDVDSSQRIAKVRGGNPILFPFSARTYQNGQLGRWTDPTGIRRPMPMHGFARQGTFETTRVDKKGFSARLVPDAEAQEAYPFEYDFEVIYRFDEKEFSVELRLANRHDIAIPWSAGHHFYFTLPWAEGTSRKDYELRLPAKKAARQDEQGKLKPVTGFKKIEPMSNPRISDRIHYQLTSPIVECVCLKDDSRIEIEVGTTAKPNPGYAVVTWTESDTAPFYCIEPWMGPPNSPEHKVGLHTVAPGETSTFSVTVRI